MMHHIHQYILILCFLLLNSIASFGLRIALKGFSSSPESTAFQQKHSNSNDFSPFDALHPEVWKFDAFVGTPRNSDQKEGQIVPLSLEIDSGDTWIMESFYDGRDSTTFVADKTATFEAVDLFGRVSGYAANDTMNLIGYTHEFTAQPFGMVTNAANYHPSYGEWTRGKLGLAWPGAGSAQLNASLVHSSHFDSIGKVSNHCVLLFAPVENFNNELYAKNVDWIIGLPVLRRYCQLYDIQNREIAFARAIKI